MGQWDESAVSPLTNKSEWVVRKIMMKGQMSIGHPQTECLENLVNGSKQQTNEQKVNMDIGYKKI